MAGETRNLVFSEGTSVTAPAQVNLVATSIPTFANDAAFESNKGSAGTAGDIYQNTTDGLIHHHDGTSWKSVDNVLVNLTATTDPGVSDDNTAGYGVGSKWVNTTTDRVFFALDVSTGAAIWRSMVDAESAQTLSGAKTFSAAITVSNTTNSTNKDTGSIVTEGGLGVELDAHIGGSLTVDTDLTVSGTTTTLNTQTLDVEDTNITVNKGGNQASADDVAGLTVEMSDATNASIIYDKDAASYFRVGLVGSEIEVVNLSSVQNLTNKQLFDLNTHFVNSSDTTKQLIMNLAGNGTGDKVTFNFSASTAVDAFNFPDTSGTTVNVLTDSLQATITNKIYDGGTASNNSRINLPTETTTNLDALTDVAGDISYDSTKGAPQWNDGTGWQDFGSGQGGINFIDNGNAEGGTTGWATFDDGGSYVDGTGGSPANVTWTRVTGTPLRGNGTFRFTKSAADASGEGVSYDYTITEAHKAEAQRIRFYYKPDATYVDEEIEVRIYDVTNSQIIKPVPAKIQNTSLSERPFFEFQSSASGTSYRISFVVIGTSATAYTVDFDEIEVGPKEFGTINQITDGISFAPTYSGIAGTPLIEEGTYKRIGEEAYIRYLFQTSGSGVTSDIILDLPAGLTISNDSEKLPIGVNANQEVGIAMARDLTGNRWTGNAYINDSTSIKISGPNNVGDWASAVPFTWVSGDLLSVTIQVPIEGWSSGSEIQNIYTNRDIKATGAGLTSNLTLSGSPAVVKYLELVDTTASYDPSTGIFTVPEKGDYRYELTLATSGLSSAAGHSYQTRVYKNGATERQAYKIAYAASATPDSESLSFMLEDLEVGDTIETRVYEAGGTGYSISSSTLYTTFSIEKTKSPKQVTAAEKVVEVYTSNAGTVYTNTDAFVCEDQLTSTHGAYNTTTGVFTAPRAGLLQMQGVTRGVGSFTDFYMYVRKNSGDYKIASDNGLGPSTTKFCNFAFTEYVQQGDTFTVNFAIDASYTSTNNVFYHQIAWIME